MNIAHTNIEAAEERLLRDGSPFALCDIDVAAIRYRAYRNGPKNLSDIYRKAALLKQSIFVVQGDERISYDEILQPARRLAQGLAEHFDVGRGMRVVLALENGPDWIISFIAITSLGASAILAARHDQAALKLYCDIAQCPLTIAQGVSGITVGLLGDTSPILLNTLIAQARADEWAPATLESDAEAVIAFTSGSTGVPKAAILTHRGIVTGLLNTMLAGALANAEAHTIRPKTPRRPQLPGVLLLSPLSHISGYSQILLIMMLGGKLIFPGTEEISQIISLIAREKATSLAGATPATIRSLLNTLPSKHDVSSLASLNINGFALHPRLIGAIEAKLPDVVIGTGYGMTETNGSVCAIAGDALKNRPRSCGRLVPTVECKITDDAGEPLGAEKAGNIWLRGAMAMRGYSGADAASLDDGWLNTGDIGYLTPDRHLHILDRRDGFITTCSGTIASLEIERATVEHPGVDEAVVICGPDKSEPTIFVLSTGNMNAELLRDRLISCFGEFAFDIVLRDEFPRTLSGKIDRRLLETQMGTV